MKFYLIFLDYPWEARKLSKIMVVFPVSTFMIIQYTGNQFLTLDHFFVYGKIVFNIYEKFAKKKLQSGTEGESQERQKVMKVV